MTWRKRIRIVWMTFGFGFMGWIVWNMQAHGVPADAWQSTSSVAVERGDHATAFLPVTPQPDRPFVAFLPGGAVDPDAYVPVVRALADEGWPVALVELPWRTAFTDDARRELWRRVAAVQERWARGRPLVLGGHSRGAALSAQFAAEHRTSVSALMLIATTHPRDHDLSQLSIPVIKVSGTRDCVASEAASRANAHLLPSATTWVSLDGANHAQFGYYGSQLGDCSATITREDQQRQLLNALLRWLGANTEGMTRAPVV